MNVLNRNFPSKAKIGLTLNAPPYLHACAITSGFAIRNLTLFILILLKICQFVPKVEFKS